MAYGFGKMLQIISVINGSVLNLQAAQDAADKRLEAQTKNLILWTKVLAAASLLLLVGRSPDEVSTGAQPLARSNDIAACIAMASL